MKKKLLKPPQNEGGIFFSLPPDECIRQLKTDIKAGVAHQPYFFNPGVSLKFIFLDSLPQKDKKMLFVDTDRVNIKVNVPSPEAAICSKEFISSERVLYDYPAPQPSRWKEFFLSVEETLDNSINGDRIIPTLNLFKEIVITQKYRFLKQVLAESFLKFYDIKGDYSFVSDIIRSEEFKDFFTHIYKDDDIFRDVFNTALDDYKKEFRFRYKNFPFPKLQADELPFWIVEDGIRKRCFKKEVSLQDFPRHTIFPRAATLTIFLRLYKLDFFIHGIGGANYEWVNDRVIERFFKRIPPRYAVISGTFLLDNSVEREFPYFFYSPDTIKARIDNLLKNGI